MRPGDTIARFGADEFALCLEDIRHEDDALRASARIKQALQAPVSIQGQSLFTSASMGIALSSDHYHQAEELIRDADIAMYHAKAEGRAHHAVFRSSMYHQVIRRAQTENELRHALDHEEFVLYYQPIVMAQTQTVAGFEALLRWHNPRLGGNIPTSEFIYLAEDTGLIVPIGWWVLEQACRQIQSLETVPERGEPVTVSVNLSAKQFSQKNLVPTIETILAKTGLSPSRLHLEITESALMDRSGQAIEILNQLNTLGIHCHIDDFGTGYSSLSYLYQFPCSALKIDRSFISRMETSSKHKAIVETIVTLAHNLDLQVVAEGIETRAQCDAVKAIGCEYLQGFWLSLPLSWQEVTPLIAQDQVTLPVQT
jgi:EAL domain-containing protein (putative c-di-GMP-specific phosphodiesterase class I)